MQFTNQKIVGRKDLLFANEMNSLLPKGEGTAPPSGQGEGALDETQPSPPAFPPPSASSSYPPPGSWAPPPANADTGPTTAVTPVAAPRRLEAQHRAEGPAPLGGS